MTTPEPFVPQLTKHQHTQSITPQSPIAATIMPKVPLTNALPYSDLGSPVHSSRSPKFSSTVTTPSSSPKNSPSKPVPISPTRSSPNTTSQPATPAPSSSMTSSARTSAAWSSTSRKSSTSPSPAPRWRNTCRWKKTE